ncbi:hypothetical protein TNCV_2897361 [Trichonephila clavipes]|nr:hypothetical protein TNCV_2897361 [Trichonephila clavipes]
MASNKRVDWIHVGRESDISFVKIILQVDSLVTTSGEALHTEEALNTLFDFSIASKATPGEIFRQSQKQMKVTWCEIRTVIQALQTNSCNIVLRCRLDECGLALSSNNRTSDLKSPGRFFRIVPSNFDRVSQYLPRSIDGSNL